jgi:trimeric autotransporter adhesin
LNHPFLRVFRILNMRRRSFATREMRIELLEARQMLASHVESLGDLNQRGVGSSPYLVATLGGELLVGSGTSSHVRLWKTSGTETSNKLVKDFGDNSSISGSLFAHDGVVYFEASTSGNARELWRTDGTEQGTYLLKDIRQGRYGGSPTNFTSVGRTLFFVAAQQEGDFELWKTDGTADGTVLVRDIREGSGSSGPSNLFALGDRLFFFANDGISGVDIWSTDGTADGTMLLKDLEIPAGATPANPVVLNDETFLFFAPGIVDSYDLWRSDGSTMGSSVIQHIEVNPIQPFISIPAVRSGRALFTSQGMDGKPRLWQSDGTTSGTRVIDFSTASSSFSAISGILATDSAWAFFGTTPETGQELWKTDGTSEGTALVKDITPGPKGTPFGQQFSAGDRIFLVVADPESAGKIWSSDLTVEGTVLAGVRGSGEDLAFNQVLGFYRGELVFRGTANSTGDEIWSTDGTASSARLLADLNPSTMSSFPKNWTTSDQSVFFSAVDDGHFLFATDGQLAGTRKLPASFNIDSNERPAAIANMNGDLIFMPDSSFSTAGSVWTSNGTDVGTYAMANTGYAGAYFPSRRPMANQFSLFSRSQVTRVRVSFASKD